jgi:hypothetical protein
MVNADRRGGRPWTFASRPLWLRIAAPIAGLIIAVGGVRAAAEGSTEPARLLVTAAAQTTTFEQSTTTQPTTTIRATTTAPPSTTQITTTTTPPPSSTRAPTTTTSVRPAPTTTAAPRPAPTSPTSTAPVVAPTSAPHVGTCTANISNPTPTKGATVIVTYTSNVPNAEVVLTAHYKTTTTVHENATDSAGNGSDAYRISTATSGFEVFVDVQIGTARCRTSFTPL